MKRKMATDLPPESNSYEPSFFGAMVSLIDYVWPKSESDKLQELDDETFKNLAFQTFSGNDLEYGKLCVQELLRRGCNMNTPLVNNLSPIETVIMYSKEYSMQKLILESGIDKNHLSSQKALAFVVNKLTTEMNSYKTEFHKMTLLLDADVKATLVNLDPFYEHHYKGYNNLDWNIPGKLLCNGAIPRTQINEILKHYHWTVKESFYNGINRLNSDEIIQSLIPAIDYGISISGEMRAKTLDDIYRPLFRALNENGYREQAEKCHIKLIHSVTLHDKHMTKIIIMYVLNQGMAEDKLIDTCENSEINDVIKEILEEIHPKNSLRATK